MNKKNGIAGTESCGKAKQTPPFESTDLIEEFGDIVYAVDSASGEYTYLSPAFHSIVGYSLDDIRAMGGREKFLCHIIQEEKGREYSKMLLKARQPEDDKP